MMKTLLGEYDAGKARAVQWDTLHENNAIKKYEEQYGVTVAASGLRLHSRGFCGASPDGIVSDSIIIEAKCPFSIRDENVIEHIGEKSFLKFCNECDARDGYGEEGEVILNQKNQQGNAYYHQIQGNLWLTGRLLCDLVVWTPTSTLIVTVKRDDQYELKYLPVLEQFYAVFHPDVHWPSQCPVTTSLQLFNESTQLKPAGTVINFLVVTISPRFF